MNAPLILLLAALLVTPAAAQDYMAQRDRAVVWKFRKLHACPATGHVYGACAGWQVDHVVALRCGGPDTVENMQWLTVAEHRVKTRREARECRKGKRIRPPSPQ